MRTTLSVAALLSLVAFAVTTQRVPEPARADIATPRNFVSSLECQIDAVTVRFVVPSAFDVSNKIGMPAEQVWIDLSLQNNGFVPGTFINAGPFVPRGDLSDQVFAWHGVVNNSQHFYRINALAGGTWRELGRGTFETPDCAPVLEMACESTGTAAVTFGTPRSSLGPERPAIAQWIDLSIFGNPRNPNLDNGFVPGTFIGAGPFSPEGVRFTWRGITPALRHYFRVNVFHSGPPQFGDNDTWAQMGGGRFVSLDCRDLPRMRAPTP